jgi:hypothetical protein
VELLSNTLAGVFRKLLSEEKDIHSQHFNHHLEVRKMSVRSVVLIGVVVLALLLLAATALIPSAASGEEGSSRDFTHTVFGEFGSTTT